MTTDKPIRLGAQMMTTRRPPPGGRSGSALVVVLCLVLVSTIMTTSVLLGVNTRNRLAHRQVNMDRAFFIAEAGAERAAQRVLNGDAAPFEHAGDMAGGSYEATVSKVNNKDGSFSYEIVSVGTVEQTSRTVAFRGVRQVSWAQYALWYNRENGTLWIIPGERFDGRVYSGALMHFHDTNLRLLGQALFKERVWTAENCIEKSSAAVNPIFEDGIVMGADLQTMASVDFNDLQTKAQDAGLVLDGGSEITLDGNKMKITNSRKGWYDREVDLPANGLVYVKSYTEGYGRHKTTHPGNVTLRASSGLNGRLTIVADENITVQDHVRYAKDPRDHPESTDALGLIAGKNVVVGTSAPNDLSLYAHIICKEGGFGVHNYDKGSDRGTLTVYGGIVNEMRNAVGTFSGNRSTGYRKNYIYDKRYARNPPPYYPRLDDSVEWTEWDG